MHSRHCGERSNFVQIRGGNRRKLLYEFSGYSSCFTTRGTGIAFATRPRPLASYPQNRSSNPIFRTFTSCEFVRFFGSVGHSPNTTSEVDKDRTKCWMPLPEIIPQNQAGTTRHRQSTSWRTRGISSHRHGSVCHRHGTCWHNMITTLFTEWKQDSLQWQQD